MHCPYVPWKCKAGQDYVIARFGYSGLKMSRCDAELYIKQGYSPVERIKYEAPYRKYLQSLRESAARVYGEQLAFAFFVFAVAHSACPSGLFFVRAQTEDCV